MPSVLPHDDGGDDPRVGFIRGSIITLVGKNVEGLNKVLADNVPATVSAFLDDAS